MITFMFLATIFIPMCYFLKYISDSKFAIIEIECFKKGDSVGVLLKHNEDVDYQYFERVLYKVSYYGTVYKYACFTEDAPQPLEKIHFADDGVDNWIYSAVLSNEGNNTATNVIDIVKIPI